MYIYILNLFIFINITYDINTQFINDAASKHNYLHKNLYIIKTVSKFLYHTIINSAMYILTFRKIINYN
jgi:hypothetical protein